MEKENKKQYYVKDGRVYLVKSVERNGWSTFLVDVKYIVEKKLKKGSKEVIKSDAIHQQSAHYKSRSYEKNVFDDLDKALEYAKQEIRDSVEATKDHFGVDGFVAGDELNLEMSIYFMERLLLKLYENYPQRTIAVLDYIRDHGLANLKKKHDGKQV